MHKKKFLFTFSLLGLLLTSCSGGSPYIGENGNWWVGDTDTGVNASGLEGEKGDKGDKGDKGEDGVSPEVTIGENGNWFINGEDTGIKAQGEEGEKGKDGKSVVSIEKTSSDGLVDTYTITYSDNSTSTFTVTNGEDGIQGEKGEDGHTPVITIGENGNWYVDGTDTGIKAKGEDGKDGADGTDGQDGKSVVSIEKTLSDGLVDTYTISYSDGSTSTFTVTNGEDGIQGEPGEDGRTPIITIGENGNWVIDGVDTGIKAKGEDGADGKDGEDGKSAYEIYIEAHPEYTKTEEEWLDDLVNGELGNKLTHTVTFDTGCEIEVEPATVEHGELIPAPTVPKREGYELVGWYYEGYAAWMFDILPCLKDMILVAQWKVSTHTVTLTDQDGRDFISGTYEYGDTFDYDFRISRAVNKVIDKILDQNGNEVTLPLTVTEDMQLTVYFVESITITFDTQTDEIIEPMTIDNGIELEELPIPTRENYYFLGRYYMDEGFETKVEYPFNVRRREDLNLVAKWGAISEIGQFEYTELDETSVAITNYLPVGGEELVIPDGIDGKKVTELWRDAFVSLNIKTVKLGAYVYFIYDNAFSLCKDIETIVYNKVPYMKQSYMSFYGSNNITNVEALPTFDFSTLLSVPHGLTKTINFTIKYDVTTEGNNIAQGAPINLLFNVKFGRGYKTIRNYSIYNSSIISLDFEEGLTKIEVGAFSDLPLLKTVKFPNSLLEIEPKAFLGCYNFTTIVTGNKQANVTLSSFGDSLVQNVYYMGTDEEFNRFTENFEQDISQLSLRVYTNVKENDDCYYYVNGTNAWYLLRKTNKFEKVITIPNEIDGLPVSEVREFAINGPESYAVYVPKEISLIDSRAVNTYNPTVFYIENTREIDPFMYYAGLAYDESLIGLSVPLYHIFDVSKDQQLLYESEDMINLYYEQDKLITLRYLNNETPDVYINEVDGLSIGRIASFAFAGLTSYQSITVGSNVSLIDEYSFIGGSLNLIDLRETSITTLNNILAEAYVANFYTPKFVNEIYENYSFKVDNFYTYNTLTHFNVSNPKMINNLYYSGTEEEWFNVMKNIEEIACSIEYNWVE